MSRDDNLRATAFDDIADFFDDEMDRARIETILNLFNNNKRRRLWVTKERQ